MHVYMGARINFRRGWGGGEGKLKKKPPTMGKKVAKKAPTWWKLRLPIMRKK